MQMLVVGSVALDSVETPFGKIEDGLGGSATHFATSASFFVKPELVAVLGEDFPEHAGSHVSKSVSYFLDEFCF